jgi:predicted RNase H-like HicB family nuclease
VKKMAEYVVVIEHDNDTWGAYVPDLPGCVAVGPTRDEVERLIAEAIPAHIDSLRRHGDPVPSPAATGTTTVAVACARPPTPNTTNPAIRAQRRSPERPLGNPRPGHIGCPRT